MLPPPRSYLTRQRDLAPPSTLGREQCLVAEARLAHLLHLFRVLLQGKQLGYCSFEICWNIAKILHWNYATMFHLLGVLLRGNTMITVLQYDITI